ncbi:MAG TPA: FHA domain-containing protein [Thermoanaerobaculia bacterium]
MAYFVDLLKGHQASVTSHDGRTLRIGRGTNADLRFDDAGVALEHAAVEEDVDGWVLHDRGSVTGTFVNGERVASALLADGDRVEIGGYRLEVEILSRQDPLFLHVARIGDEPAAGTKAITMSTLRASSGELLDLAQRTVATRLVPFSEIRRIREAATAAASTTPPSEDKGAAPAGTVLVSPEAMAATLKRVRDAQEEAPPAEPPPAEPPATEPPRPPVRAAPRPPARRVDYARAYGLRRGVLRKSVFAAVLSLATAGTLLALIQCGRLDVFSPGPLTAVHRQATRNACGGCHLGWQRVGDRGCLAAGCHATAGAHQANLAREPSCLECHTEHRDLQALRLLQEDGGCVGCHAALETRGGSPRFAASITGFGAGEHPDFTPRSDPGALDFHHAWHLNLRRGGEPALACGSCHTRGDDGEIEPVRFERHCQRCHNLSFDRRFGSQEAPHAPPAEVLTYLAGFYSLRPEVLGRLSAGERGRLGGGRGEERQLAAVAEWNAEALVRNKCAKCHGFSSDPRRTRLAALAVRPPRLREGWLEHASFRHAPHLALENACDDCHRAARASNAAADVLLPEVAACRDCHRPPEPGERSGTGKLGRVDCLGCHGYHPEAGEIARLAVRDEETASAVR